MKTYQKLTNIQNGNLTSVLVRTRDRSPHAGNKRRYM